MLYKRSSVSTAFPSVTRPFPAGLLLLVALAPGALAQDQERKLVDRLLRPDTTLQNPAQNKKFATAATPAEKRSPVRAFPLENRTRSKNFSGTRDFPTRQLAVPSFSGAGPASGASKAAPGSRLAFATQPAGNLRSAPDSDKKRPSRAYAQSRPFLGEGKSQKSLNRQNAPLTIEQVRELLNKNK